MSLIIFIQKVCFPQRACFYASQVHLWKVAVALFMQTSFLLHCDCMFRIDHPYEKQKSRPSQNYGLARLLSNYKLHKFADLYIVHNKNLTAIGYLSAKSQSQ